MIIAIPSETPGGLEASVADHFGHCAAFTMVDLQETGVVSVSVIPNTGHAQGGCMAPVVMLKQAGADAMISGGMGMRPLAGFQQVGIRVYYNENAPTVGEAVRRLAEGKVPEFSPAQVCGGGPGGSGAGGCHGH